MAQSLTESRAMLLVGLGRVMEQRVEAALGEAGLSMRLVGALGHLASGAELSYSDLARRARVTPQSMRATVAQLVDAGAVRVDAPGQGVAARLEVTDLGAEMLGQARQAVADLDAELLDGLPGDVTAALRELMIGLLRAPD